MLHSSVSCCKCRPSALVSMRAGRAKPRPPMCGGGVGRAPAVWAGGTGRTMLLWKRRGRVFRAAWKRRVPRRCGRDRASHPSCVGCGSEADGSDASAGNGAGMRIQADGPEQPPASGSTLF
jgi:hypothetical protein